ncbi:hypothetical protein L1887_40517 [Cichorium endivia]|nr:hypothetical protein L1887_40517 [Cichorium endivia]
MSERRASRKSDMPRARWKFGGCAPRRRAFFGEKKKSLEEFLAPKLHCSTPRKAQLGPCHHHPHLATHLSTVAGATQLLLTIMPGTKRKAEASTSKASSSKHAASPAARASSKRKPEPVYMDDSDNNDEFDDEEDLLDSALHGTGSAALPDDLNEDDDDEDEDDDKEDSEEEGSDSEATDAASQDEIELASDADDFDDESDDEEQAQTDGDGGEVEIMSDEDMDGGFEDLEANGAQEDASSSATAAAYASRKASKSALYAIPTLAEVQGLKETGELFKNNVFKLKVDEMLPEVRPAYSKAGALELVLRRLHQLFQSLEPIEPLPVGDAIKRFQKQTADSKVNIPFPDPAPKADANYKLGFDKPAAMHLVGSWALKSAAKRPQGIDVDVAVVMPAELFQQKDYVNFRTSTTSTLASRRPSRSSTPIQDGRSSS